MNRFPRLFWLVPLALWTTRAAADEAETARARARQLTSEGAAAYKAEQYAQAIARFDSAYRLYPAPTLLLNISRAELKLSRCGEAERYAQLFKAAITEAQVASPDSPDEWLATVQRSCIEAEVDSAPSGATIWIDGERQTSPDKTPWTGRLPVGKHKILLWRSGYQKQGAFLTVSADAPASLALNLYPSSTAEAVPPVVVPAPAAAAGVRLLPEPARAPVPLEAAAATSRASNPALRKAGYSAIAIGGAALIAAVVLGVTVNSEGGAVGKITGPRTTSQADALLSASQSEASSADALFVIGGVLAAAGIPLAVVF